MTIQQQIESGISHHQAGRLREAEKIYRQVLAEQPDHAVALLLLGMLAGRAGRLEMAVELIRRCIQLEPDRAEAHGNLGNFLRDLGQLEEAIASYREAAVGRGGASILSNIGLPELIARTPQEYIEIAIGLANDLPRLADLRRTLRSRMQASPLMDAPRFARNVEAAYRQMWRSWCAGNDA